MSELVLAPPKETVVTDSLLSLKERFMNIAVGSRFIPCPFFMNNDPRYKETMYFQSFSKGGKLTPDEIEDKIIKTAIANQISPDELNPDQLKEFLLFYGIGIDCSGFVYQFLKQAYQTLGGKNFEEKIVNEDGKTGITKIGAKQLLLDNNSYPVENIKSIKPADFVIEHSPYSSSHSVVIANITGSVLNCIHATNEIQNSGVHPFDIRITNPFGSISEQNWEENLADGTSYDKYIQRSPLKRYVRRLKIIDNLYK